MSLQPHSSLHKTYFTGPRGTGILPGILLAIWCQEHSHPFLNRFMSVVLYTWLCVLSAVGRQPIYP